jgi:hypothetical protein
MVTPRRRILGRGATIVAVTCLSSTPAHAQADAAEAPSYGGTALLVGANYGKPLRQTFSGGLFLRTHDPGTEGAVGTIVGGTLGRHGMQVWGGRKVVAFGGGDVRAVLTRTWENPRGGASPHATYVGGEVGLGGLVGRLSFGYARRIAGSSTGSGHVFTWGVGMEIVSFRQSRSRQRGRGIGGTHISSSARAASHARRPAP